jgi:Ohr subfamily peroxiredoxin
MEPCIPTLISNDERPTGRHRYEADGSMPARSANLIFDNETESAMTKIAKVLLTGKTHTTASDARILSGDHTGNIDMKLSAPGNSAAPVYGFPAVAPHPTAEQLFAGAWSACYIAAVGLTAKEMKLALPTDTSVAIEVDLGLAGAAYQLQARLTLRVPGLDHEAATALAHGADAICPYSKATRGNIDVTLTVLTA